MENLIRLLMRFLLVPLGYCAASIAGTLVLLIAAWRLVGSPFIDDPDYVLFGLAMGTPILFVVMMVVMLMPAAIGILISEAFAIRSWIFHVLNGIAAALFVWGGSSAFRDRDMPPDPFLDQPLVIVAAGIAGGFAYWAVAGFSAGFYKPIFRNNPPPSVPATTP